MSPMKKSVPFLAAAFAIGALSSSLLASRAVSLQPQADLLLPGALALPAQCAIQAQEDDPDIAKPTGVQNEEGDIELHIASGPNKSWYFWARHRASGVGATWYDDIDPNKPGPWHHISSGPNASKYKRVGSDDGAE